MGVITPVLYVKYGVLQNPCLHRHLKPFPVPHEHKTGHKVGSTKVENSTGKLVKMAKSCTECALNFPSTFKTDAITILQSDWTHVCRHFDRTI